MVIIHFIIKTLNLKITFRKVKAHSNGQFNNLADAQAKIDRLATIPTSINHQHLPSQTITILWNDHIPIDRDVRKAIGTVPNYNHIQNHLDHHNMNDIKVATVKKLY